MKNFLSKGLRLMEQDDNKLKLDEQLVKVVLDDKTSLEARIKKVKFLVRIGADVNANLYGKMFCL